MKQNRQKIAHLQQENKDLYKQKADKLKVCYTNYYVIELITNTLFYFRILCISFHNLYVKTV